MMDVFSHERGLRQSVDWKIVGCYLLLVLIGWINIYASIHTPDSPSIFDWGSRSGKQFIWILTALGLAALILFVIPARLWEAVSVPLWVGVVVLLVAVIFLGIEVKGSRSWFEFGPVRFQPAEISKISTSLLLAGLLSRQGFKMGRPRDFLLMLAVVGIPMMMILAESETGSALVYIGFVLVLYREGLSGWWIALLGLVVVLFITTLTLSPYWSILILSATLIAVNAMYSEKDFKLWFYIGGGFILLMAFVPALWNLVTTAVETEVRRRLLTFNLPAPGQNTHYFWSFLARIKPIWFLLAGTLIPLPWLSFRSFRTRDNFLGISLGAFLIGIALVFSTDFIFDNVLQDHQRRRIEVLLGMKEDPSGVGYNVAQSKIAIGSGGFFGKGYLNGTQTTYGFVPEQSTDFIFCTVGEEWGFLGSLLVIGLYAFLIFRLISDAEKSREHFTRIYGYCVAACIFMHLFINIGMTVGLMPVIGIPLPLLSYGGSSLWAFTILIFIFLALYRQEKKYF